MIIDTHQHFWRLDRGDYSFPSPSDPVLYRDFLPADFAPEMAATGVTASIAVQATESLAETEYLLELAGKYQGIAGVVGWCNLAALDADAQIARFLTRGPLVGIRPMLQKADDATWLLSSPARDNVAQVVDRGLVFEALIDVRHLAVIDQLAAGHPHLCIVIDHMAKPWRHPDRFADWQDGMVALARRDNCLVKISGYPFGTAAGQGLSYAALLDAVQHWFGVERMIWGSDWPVMLRGTDYRSGLAAARRALPSSSHSRIFAGNAIEAFGLKLGSEPVGS